MEDSSAPQQSAPALTKEQEALGTAPGVGQPQEIPFVPGAPPPTYYAQPLPDGASYMPAGAAQPFSGGQIAYMPGSAQPITIVVSYDNFHATTQPMIYSMIHTCNYYQLFLGH